MVAAMGQAGSGASNPLHPIVFDASGAPASPPGFWLGPELALGLGRRKRSDGYF